MRIINRSFESHENWSSIYLRDCTIHFDPHSTADMRILLRADRRRGRDGIRRAFLEGKAPKCVNCGLPLSEERYGHWYDERNHLCFGPYEVTYPVCLICGKEQKEGADQ